MTNAIETHRAVVRAYFAAVSRGDSAAVAACYAEGGMIFSMGTTHLPPVIRGRVDIAAATAGVTDAFPDGLGMTIHTMTAEDDRVAVEVESAGTHVSGKMYNNKYHFLMRFENGLICEMREYFDSQHVNDILYDGKRP